MRWYRLYYKSVGGGVECEGPRKYTGEHDATVDAYLLAVEDYESFEGYHGIPSVDNIMDEKEDYGLASDASEDECWEAYYEERQSWLDYWVEEANGPDDIDEDYQ